MPSCVPYSLCCAPAPVEGAVVKHCTALKARDGADVWAHLTGHMAPLTGRAAHEEGIKLCMQRR